MLFFCGGFASAGLLAPAAFGQVHLDHDFSSGSRAIHDLPNSAAWHWHQGEPNSVVEAAPGHIGWANASFERSGLAVPFADPGGVSLGVGERLIINASVWQSGVASSSVAFQQRMRWSVVNFEGGTQPSGDLPVGERQFDGAGATGYFVNFAMNTDTISNTGATGEGVRWFKTNDPASADWHSTVGGSWNMKTGEYPVSLDGTEQVFFAEDLYHIEMLFHRVSETALDMHFAVRDDDGTTLLLTTLTDNDNPFFAFDTFYVSAGHRNNTGGDGEMLYFTKFTVIPEPSTYALLFGLAGIALVVLRRRIRKG